MFRIRVTKIEPSRRVFVGKCRLSPHLTFASHDSNSITVIFFKPAKFPAQKMETGTRQTSGSRTKMETGTRQTSCSRTKNGNENSPNSGFPHKKIIKLRLSAFDYDSFF